MTKLSHVFLWSFLSLTIISCNTTEKKTLFKSLPERYTGIDFNNEVTENDSINPIDMEYLYNGGGVAAGDFNKDGLPDLYFTGSQVSSELYLNKGDYKFQNITKSAKVGTTGKWCNGASVVDINNDSWPDIYVCGTNSKNPDKRRNLLFINQGIDKQGIPHFKESAREYGLADTSYSVSAAFFDAENDGDLDLFLLTTIPASRDVVTFSGNNQGMPVGYRCKLYQNNPDPVLNHPVYTNIAPEAGITYEGYGLGVSITDINQDGWKDIAITNDFLSSDVLYINNKNGTFTNKEFSYFKHSSANAMGNDFADINNDGLADFITVDMAAEYNWRKKKNGNANNYNNYVSMVDMGYMLQYPRNTLQINQGPRPSEDGVAGDPVFSEIGYLSGIAETDWSWSPLFADFDDDTFKDLIVTNGYPKDVTDHDFASYRSQAAANTPKQTILNQLPSIKIPNYAFKNAGNSTFKNVTTDWGFDVPSFSTGAIYVDLTGKGHLDYVVNNINAKAFVYKNTLNEGEHAGANFLNIKFKGDSQNINGLGAVAEIRYNNGKMQTFENSPYKGYLSCVPDIAHFGLGKIKTVDTVKIIWPGGKTQLIKNVNVNQQLVVDIVNAEILGIGKENKPYLSLFRDVTKSVQVNFLHQEADFVDFDIQRLMPHKLSQYGPGLAVADVDGNGTDDIYIGGSGRSSGMFLLQGKDGKFKQRAMKAIDDTYDDLSENRGVLFFDALGKGYKDLYVTSGSNESASGSPHYQDRLYLNDGKGNFTLAKDALPVNTNSKSCVKAADYDHNGTLDIFVGGRTIPGEYPKPASSMILRNDSKNNTCKFTDVTKEVAPFLNDIGMVSDALWTDFDEDGWLDLILVGEFMPVTFIKNNKGRFVNVTAKMGLQDELGCWNSIVSGDFTNTGHLDYVVGNLGNNTFYKASKKRPVRVYAKDFDQNGSYDAIPSVYMKDEDGNYQEFPAFTRDDMIKQMIGFRRKYPTHKGFGKATMKEILSDEELKGALIEKANNMSTSIIRRNGKTGFTMSALPMQAQYAPVFAMVADDFDNDGNVDIALTGNDFSIEVGSGRCDAMNGLVLKGNGQGGFLPVSIQNSGLFIPGDGKALVKLKGPGNKYLVAASQNRGPLKIFASGSKARTFAVRRDDVYAMINYKNGQRRKIELYYGDSFESQSSRFIKIDDKISTITIVDTKGIKRTAYTDKPS